MQSLSSSTNRFLSSIGGEQGKALRIAKNNAALKDAIVQVWGSKPKASKWLLGQINAMYIEIDETPHKGRRQSQKPARMVLKVRDSMARAEFNARRESLQIALANNGIQVEEIKLMQAGRDDKQHRTFSDADIEGDADKANNTTIINFREENARALRYSDQMALLETLRRAFCLSFEDSDDAYAVLELIEGAYLYPLKSTDGRRDIYRYYRVHFYAPHDALGALRLCMNEYTGTIKSKARQLGLNITGFNTYESPASLHGKQAFPRLGHPVPYLEDTPK